MYNYQFQSVPKHLNPYSSICELSTEQLYLVSGGDDAGCTPGDSGADGNCAAQGESSGDSIGTLSEVTVFGSPDNSLGDFQAEQMVQNIELAHGNPVFAAILLGWTLTNYFSNIPASGPIGNPMGDPSPGDGP